MAALSTASTSVGMSALVGTFAGSGTDGFKDGAAAEAQFKRPYSVAVTADGTVLVADSSNQRIRSIARTGGAALPTAPPVALA